MDLRDRYPAIERPLRGSGSPEAVAKCLEPLLMNLERIKNVITRVCDYKFLDAKDIYVFQSRAMGTCKPTSDIDLYIQLTGWESIDMIEKYGVHYKDTSVKVICGEWGTKFFADLPVELKEELKDLKVDMFFGVNPTPPAKYEYRGRNYYVNLRELRDH